MFGKKRAISPQGGYTSDITDFLRAMVDKDPGLEQRQRDGRALLWDKKVSGLGEQFLDASSVPTSPVPQRPQWG